MKVHTMQKTLLTIGALVSVFCLLVCGIIAVARGRSAELVLSGSTQKETFILGEPVSLTVEVANNGDEPQEIPSGGVEVGNLQIYVRREDEKPYKQFLAVDWGTLRGGWMPLKSQQSHLYSTVTILWSGTPRLSHLSTKNQNEYLSRNVSTEYVFDEPGVYYVKATLNAKPGSKEVIETPPIRIVIENPQGEDAIMWNRLKENPKLGRFIQTGDASGNSKSEREDFLGAVQATIVAAPNSRLASIARAKLAQYREQEKKRSEMYKNLPGL